MKRVDNLIALSVCSLG